MSARRRYLVEISLGEQNEPVTLSPRELECLGYLMEAKSVKEICRVMSISPRTVEHHLENIRAKADCKSSMELMSKMLGSTLSMLEVVDVSII